MNGFDFAIGKAAGSADGGNGANYVFNQDLTEAFFEARDEDLKVLSLLTGTDEEVCDVPIVPCNVGSVANEEVLKKLNEANNLLDIMQTDGTVDIEPFQKPDMFSNGGYVSFTVNAFSANFRKSVKKAFGQLVNLCDNVLIRAINDTCIRYTFSFDNIWKEYRPITEQEKEEFIKIMSINNEGDIEND